MVSKSKHSKEDITFFALGREKTLTVPDISGGWVGKNRFFQEIDTSFCLGGVSKMNPECTVLHASYFLLLSWGNGLSGRTIFLSIRSFSST